MITADSIHRRIRGTQAWRKLSKQVCTEEPTCWLRLPGCTGRSTTGDHIIPMCVRPDLALVRSNVRGACKPCNDLRRDTPVNQLDALRCPSKQAARQRARANRRRPAKALQLFGKAR